MLTLLFDGHVLRVRPDGPITRGDVATLMRTEDEYLPGPPKIAGVMEKRTFPGFASVGAFADYAHSFPITMPAWSRCTGHQFSPRTRQPRGSPVNPNKALWEKGDFTRIAASMRRERRGARRASSGSRRGSRFSISDAATERRRCRRPDWARTCWASTSRATSSRPGTAARRSEGLTNCRFQEGDATDLHELQDQAFDLVVSIFGAMFAPKPFDVAKEMVRVTRPGGRIVMGNWIPNDPTLVAQILKISCAYSPPPPEGFVSPMTWGVESQRDRAIRRRGRPRGQHLVRRGHVHVQLPSPPSELVDAFRQLLRARP